ncbi:MAG TPA: hypothetical protein VGB30_00315 [bacterium]|jgi:spore coat polysaccharide biosynthesis predicted glycosyltransferase SpsG
MADTGGILFRVDGSRQLGLGHISRCISLADAIRSQAPEMRIGFAVKEFPDCEKLFEGSGFDDCVVRLPVKDDIEIFARIVKETSPSAIVADIDLRGKVEKFLGSIFPGPILVSLHEHNYPVFGGDIVIAPTVRPMEILSHGTMGVTHFSGADYVILPPDITSLKNNVEPAKKKVSRGFVSTGGSDPTGLTIHIIESLKDLNDTTINWKIIIGPASGYRSEALSGTAPENVELINGGDISRADFLEWMSAADLLISNGGTTLYESLSLGRPTLAHYQNEFEAEVIDILSDEGACVKIHSWVVDQAAEQIGLLAGSSDLRSSYSKKAMKLIDGKGSVRIAGMILARIK